MIELEPIGDEADEAYSALPEKKISFAPPKKPNGPLADTTIAEFNVSVLSYLTKERKKTLFIRILVVKNMISSSS